MRVVDLSNLDALLLHLPLANLLQTMLQLRNLIGQLLDNSPRIMRSLRQLFLNLPMDVQVLLQVAYLLDELLVFEDQFLALFGLELQLTGELMVLKHCQPRGGVELLLLQRQQIRTHIFDLGQHLIPQPINRLHFLPLLIGHLLDPFFLLRLDCPLERAVLVIHLLSLTHVDVVLLQLLLKFSDLILCNSAVFLKLSVLHGLLVTQVRNGVRSSRQRSFMRFSSVILVTYNSQILPLFYRMLFSCDSMMIRLVKAAVPVCLCVLRNPVETCPWQSRSRDFPQSSCSIYPAIV